MFRNNIYKFIHESSNINEVIRAVLNIFFFFLRKDFTGTKKTQKSTKMHKSTKKTQKSTKTTKSTKTQPSKSTKTQISEQKLKMRLKNI